MNLQEIKFPPLLVMWQTAEHLVMSVQEETSIEFFATKTGEPAEPLGVDLKDPFQVIYNVKKKEEDKKKVEYWC